MNIEQYRAMKMQEAQEQQQSDSKGETVDVQAQSDAIGASEQDLQETTQELHASAEGGTEAETQTSPSETTPDHVEIDGKTYTLDELKGGILRQSDYTRKTQELAQEKERLKLAEQYYQAVNSNPKFAQELAESFNLPYTSPEDARYEELNQKYHQTLLEKEISELETKYSDFDATEVVNIAYEKGITSLEDAYILSKGRQPQETQQFDIEALTEQIRQSVLKDLQSNVDTSTIISTGGDASSITQTEPELSPQELKVAAGLKMTKDEYLKFKRTR